MQHYYATKFFKIGIGETFLLPSSGAPLVKVGSHHYLNRSGVRTRLADINTTIVQYPMGYHTLATPNYIVDQGQDPYLFGNFFKTTIHPDPAVPGDPAHPRITFIPPSLIINAQASPVHQTLLVSLTNYTPTGGDVFHLFVRNIQAGETTFTEWADSTGTDLVADDFDVTYSSGPPPVFQIIHTVDSPYNLQLYIKGTNGAVSLYSQSFNAQSSDVGPPIFGVNWTTDNNNNDPGILRFLNHYLVPSVLRLSFQWKASASPTWIDFAFNPLNAGDFNSQSGLASGNYDVRCAFAAGAGDPTPIGPYSEAHTVAVT